MIIQNYDIIALTASVQTLHKQTRQPVLLRCGQMGTVLDRLDDDAYLIDFADADGQTYAMETVCATQIMVLFQEPILQIA